MKYFIISALLLCSLHLTAQTDTASIVVYKDARIDNLVKKQVEINELTTRDARSRIPGFRILVISTNDRNKLATVKMKIYQEFPELKAYQIWQPPFLKLKVGDFRTREEAEEYLTDIQRFFPAGVYIIRDTIEVNPDKSAKL